ncbi:MAG TPA: helix-turn-helix domain-containing protein [Burkholderiaceae bacterium]|jgi:AraC-like DNA-binding protein
MVVEWSTDNIAPKRRFEEWREACCQQVYALTPERRDRSPFNGRLLHHCAGALDVVDVHCDGHLVQRRPHDIRAQPSGTFYVYRQLDGRAWFEQRDRRLVAETGDIVIADPNVAFATGADRSFDFRLWRLDRSRLQPMLALRSGELPMIKVDHGSGEGALIGAWLDSLLRNYVGMSASGLDLAVGTLCALVANAAGLAPEMRERGRTERRAAQLQRVLRLIELRSAEPDLCAESVARDAAISLRTLHQLFEPSGTSFHEKLTQQRLARAEALLRDSTGRRLSTVEIGFAAGFREASTFYRRFKQRHGVTPGEWRGT